MGGSIFLSITSYILIFRNQLWLRISFIPPFYPALFIGCLTRRVLIRFLISWERLDACQGNVSSSDRMLSQILSVSCEQKGGRPVTSSQSIAPKQQQSTGQLCPTLSSISGGIYSGLPQKEYANSLISISGFASPKSPILACPSPSRNMFSGLISRYMMCWLCNYSIPRQISVK